MFVTFSDSEVKTLRLITSRHLSCAALAKELKVSRATAAKIISSLRHKRVPISTRRDSAGWFYELLPKPDPDLAGLIGAGGRGGRAYSISVDEDLVEHLGEEASKKQTVAR